MNCMEKKVSNLSVFRKNLVYNTLGELDSNQPEFLVSESLYELPHGKLVKETHWTENGQVEQQTVYSYTPQGFLLREELVDSDGSTLECRSFEPDSNNLIQIERLHYADGSADRILYVRDSNQKLVRKEFYADENDLEVIEEFAYDGENLLRQTKRDNNDDLIAESHYTYNDMGLISELTVNDLEEDINYQKHYAYDENGFLLQVTTFNEEGDPVERITHENNEAGKPVKITDENKRQKNTTTLEYNEFGEVIFQAETDRHGQLVKQLEKSFDDNNLLKETQVLVRDFQRGFSRSYVLRHQYVFFDNQTD